MMLMPWNWPKDELKKLELSNIVTPPVVTGPPELQMFKANETVADAPEGISPEVPTQLLTMVMLGGGGVGTAFRLKVLR